jgi:hypothetical protein
MARALLRLAQIGVVDAITEYVAVLDHHVAHVNADAEVYVLVRRRPGVRAWSLAFATSFAMIMLVFASMDKTSVLLCTINLV